MSGRRLNKSPGQGEVIWGKSMRLVGCQHCRETGRCESRFYCYDGGKSKKRKATFLARVAGKAESREKAGEKHKTRFA